MAQLIGSLVALVVGLLIVMVVAVYSTVLWVNWPDSWSGLLVLGPIALVGIALAFLGGRSLWRKMAHGAN